MNVTCFYDQTPFTLSMEEKVAALTRCGIAVLERVPHIFPANGHNERYLKTKAARSGHLF